MVGEQLSMDQYLAERYMVRELTVGEQLVVGEQLLAEAQFREYMSSRIWASGFRLRNNSVWV